MEVSTRTGALAVNAAQTAAEIVVPPEHEILLEITSPWAGVQDGTLRLLREIHHPFQNWAETLSDLHRRAMGDIAYYDRDPRSGTGFSILSGFYARIASEATDEPTRERAIRLWLAFLLKLVREAPSDESHVVPVEDALAELGGLLREDSSRVPRATQPIRRLARALAGAGTEAERAVGPALALLSGSLEQVYAAWVAREDPAAWHAAERPGAALPPGIARIARAAAVERLACVRALVAAPQGPERVDGILALPDDDEIASWYLGAADSFGGASTADVIARVGWLLHVVHGEHLALVHDEALREIGRCFARTLVDDDPAGHEALLRHTLALLRERLAPSRRTVLAVLRRVGCAVLATGDPALADILVEEVVGLEFAHPEFAGFTSEWSPRVQPAHLQNVRAYLEMIEVDPALARPLLAALVVHLRVGGVFVSDTDLFQRDVSGLLASGIRPVYAQVKHLLRLLPVFFNDIGAEGALRDVSTRLDELRGRRDRLFHFVRKQSHVGCNPALVTLVEEIVRYLATGETAALRAWLPPSVFEGLDVEGPDHAGMHAILLALAGDDDLSRLVGLDPAVVEERLAVLDGADEVDRERVVLLVRLHHELRRKYALDPLDVIDRLRAHRGLEPRLVTALEDSLEAGRDEDALVATLAVLERLQEIVLSEEPTAPVESIYRKRHIAVGIPSMYGSYHEPRLEAFGLTLRLESLAGALLDRVVASRPPAADREGMRDAARWVGYLLQALRLDGFKAQGVRGTLALLEEAIEAGDASPSQFGDVFQMLARSVDALIRAQFLDVYEEPAQRILAGLIERGAIAPAAGDTAEETMLKRSETFFRSVLAESLGVQRLDALVGRVLGVLARAPRATARRHTPAALDLTRCVVPLGDGEEAEGGIIRLGNKAYVLDRLARIGIAVPPAFVLTTDLFKVKQQVVRDPVARAALARQVRAAVGRLERLTGRTFGGTSRPLLLSVRSGASISMPGILTSFMNVGINPEIASALAATPGHGWAAWDAYRRFVQLWGMSHGLQRDEFDRLIAEAKRARSVAKKALLSEHEMRDLALSYRAHLVEWDVPVVDDPFAQLLACVDFVQRSWDAEQAAVYRSELGIADDWGTAVTVQPMVYGNLGQRSGTGVVLTRHPHHSSPRLELFGDFVVQGQGEDVVGGVVETFPVTERQRRDDHRQPARSLERDFPAVYGVVRGVAEQLLHEQGMNHQEIEFTFESDSAADVWILQARDTVVAPTSLLPVFMPSPELERSRLGEGVGAAGGALSGRVALDAEGIARVRDDFPGDPVILLRPDTVPDDLPLVLKSDGVLTALGGATSHAAVAAKRLGRTCVVGCTTLDVHAQGRVARLGSTPLTTGALISIDGIGGAVYLGAHPTKNVRVGGRAL